MKFLHPRSIALIGASDNPQKLGYQILAKLKRSKLKVYAVNSKYKHYPSITAIPQPVDQAIIAIPAEFVPQAVSGCILKKVNSIVIISSGFSESGPSGTQLEVKLKTVLLPFTGELLGPNCLGYADPSKNLDLTFAKASPPPGNIAFITQSGALGSYLFDWAQSEHLGFSKFISLGNRLGVNENQLLNFLATDKETKVIGLYLESFANPIEFLKIAGRASRIKPIIVLFGGQTKAGKKAAAGHTASLSPANKLIKTMIRQSGCLEANSLEEFTNLLEIFSLEPPLIDNDLAIITNAGGPAILASDSAAQNQFKAAPPLDVLGDALADRFITAFKQVIKDKVKDAFLIIITPQTSTQLLATCQGIINQFKTVKKPLVVSLLGGELTRPAEAFLRQNQVPTIEFPQNAVKSLSKLYYYWHNRRHHYLYPVRSAVKTKKTPSLPAGNLSWPQISKLAKLYHLPLVKTLIVRLNNLNYLSQELGFPLVLKADSAAALHRTEAKGLYLNLNSRLAVKNAFQRLAGSFNLILAQPQITSGHELFIGFIRTPGWPILLTLGSGGIYTEIYQDVARIFLPINQKIILDLLLRTKLGQILNGARGLPKINLKPVLDLILNAAQLITDYRQISEININPAIISASSIHLVDIKITVQPTGSNPVG